MVTNELLRERSRKAREKGRDDSVYTERIAEMTKAPCTDAWLVERLTIDDTIRFMETACRNWVNFAIKHSDADDMRLALEAFRNQALTEAAASITALEAEVARLRPQVENADAVWDAKCDEVERLRKQLSKAATFIGGLTYTKRGEKLFDEIHTALGEQP